LFVPQQHPARDLQDTFYVADPPKADRPRPDPATEAILDEMEKGSRRLFSTDEKKESRSRDFEQVIYAIERGISNLY
jgi:phenylalanyl-tRNA synthetase alpha chain